MGENRKATINPENNDDNCFQYALSVALYIRRNPQRMSKIKHFTNQYNWKDIDFASHSEGWEKIGQNNKIIAFNILFLSYNTKERRLAYKPKHNFKHENQVLLLIITDAKKWHHFVAITLPALLRGMTSNHNGGFYCLNCFLSYSTKNKLKKQESVYNDHDYCYV